jgi:hypothetical protein
MLGLVLHLLKIMPISDGVIYAIEPLTMLAIGAGAKALTGIGQLLGSGRKKAEPKYEIPKEVGEAIGLARGMAAEGMPAQQYYDTLQNIQQSSVLAGRNIASLGRGSALAGQGNIQAQQSKSVLSLGAQDAAARQQNQRFLYSALMAGAQAKDKQFANQWQSWMNKEQQRRALIGSGIQNIAGSVDTFMGGYLNLRAMGELGGRTTDNVLGPTITPVSGREARSSMSAIMGSGTMPPMPGAQRPTANYIPTANMPFYGQAMEDLFSQPVGR